MIRPVSAWSRLSALRAMGACLCSLLFTTAMFPPRLLAEAAMLRSPRQSEDIHPVLSELSGGQTHSYQITLDSGQYLRIAISPRGPRGIDVNAGRYEVRIEALRPATEQDKTRIAAESAEWAAMHEKNNAPEKWRQAIVKFEEALTLWRKLGDRQGELRMLARLGGEYLNIGEPQKALSYYQEALPLARASGNRYQEANLLLSSGNAYRHQNEGQKALEAYNQARLAFASLSRQDKAADATAYIGLVHQSLGDARKSLEYFEQARQTYSSVKSASRQCNMLNNIGAAYNMLREFPRAQESFNRAIAIARERRLTGCEGSALRHLGYVYINLGDHQKALESFNEGLGRCRAAGERICEAGALRGIGSVSRSLGDNEKALDFLGQALNKFRSYGERNREAATLYQMAQVNQALGKLSEARQQAEQALDIMESVRADVVSRQLRESFFASAQSRFALYIDLLMQLHRKHPAEGHDATALRANERARARGLLDLLAEAGADFRQGVSPGLLDLERSLQRQINAKAAARASLLDDDGAEGHDASFDKEISELTSHYREVEARIRAASPHYAALTQPQPLSVAEIQHQLLDENTVLLEFALGRKRSWLWAVTPQSLDSYSLPPEDEIGAAARKVYKLLTSRQPKKDLTESQQQRLIVEADAEFTTEIFTLSRMLLGPIREHYPFLAARQGWITD